jgi:hypothetical protein
MHPFMYPELIEALREDRIRYHRRGAARLFDETRAARRRGGPES